MQGVAAAKNAWKKRNVQPVTKKEEKKARPTGRGDGGPQQHGGRQGALAVSLDSVPFRSAAGRWAIHRV